jgi:hypothetical protein
MADKTSCGFRLAGVTPASAGISVIEGLPA